MYGTAYFSSVKSVNELFIRSVIIRIISEEEEISLPQAKVRTANAIPSA